MYWAIWPQPQVISPIFQNMPRLPSPLGTFLYPSFLRLPWFDRLTALGVVARWGRVGLLCVYSASFLFVMWSREKTRKVVLVQAVHVLYNMYHQIILGWLKNNNSSPDRLSSLRTSTVYLSALVRNSNPPRPSLYRDPTALTAVASWWLSAHCNALYRRTAEALPRLTPSVSYIYSIWYV